MGRTPGGRAAALNPGHGLSEEDATLLVSQNYDAARDGRWEDSIFDRVSARVVLVDCKVQGQLITGGARWSRRDFLLPPVGDDRRWQSFPANSEKFW